MIRGETRQTWNQPQRGKTGRARHRHLARGHGGLQTGADHQSRVAQSLQAIHHGTLQGAAGVGQRQGAVLALKQICAYAGFQLLNLPADGRLRQKQLVRRQSKTKCAGGGFKTAQEFKFG